MTTDHPNLDQLQASLREAHQQARRRKPSPATLARFRYVADPDDALDLAYDYEDDVRRGYVTEEDEA